MDGDLVVGHAHDRRLDYASVKTSEIRETYLSFFEERGHLRVPSASLIPAPEDTSTLLTIAGMQPFKPYFRGDEQPPSQPPRPRARSASARPTSTRSATRAATSPSSRCSATGASATTSRRSRSPGGSSSPWTASASTRSGSGSTRVRRRRGARPRARTRRRSRSGERTGPRGADRAPAALGELLAGGRDRSLRPLLGDVPDRGPEFGGPDERPGDDTDRFLEYWNHVFMSYELHEDGSLTPLPEHNIDTGLGLERMAAILQGVDSVFETDAFRPLSSSPRSCPAAPTSDDRATTRAMRIIADHSRGMTFLIADGVVPSNEERGYVLRRVMRRAIQQGRVLGLESPWLGRFAERTIELMADAYPELARAARDDHPLGRRRGGGFGRTLDRGTELLAQLVARGEGAGDLVDRRGGRLQAPRHLRLPLRPDQGAARRGGPVGRRLRASRR